MLAAVPVITAVVYVLPDAVTITTLVTVVDADADVDSVTEADSEADSDALSVAEADSEADSDAVSVAVSVADAVSVAVAVGDVVSVTVVDADAVSVALSVAASVVVEETDKEEELETGAPSVILNGARPSEGYAMPAKEQEASPEVLEVWKPGGFVSAYFLLLGEGEGRDVHGANVLTPTGGTPARLLGMLVCFRWVGGGWEEVRKRGRKRGKKGRRGEGGFTCHCSSPAGPWFPCSGLLYLWRGSRRRRSSCRLRSRGIGMCRLCWGEMLVLRVLGRGRCGGCGDFEEEVEE